MSLSTGAGILKRLLGESKYRGSFSRDYLVSPCTDRHSQVDYLSESPVQGQAFSRDYLVSLSTGAGILKRLLGESKYMDRHSQVDYLVPV